MVYIWYGTNRGLSQFLPEETAPLFSFEVVYRYLAIQTSFFFVFFLRDHFLKAHSLIVAKSANSTFKSQNFPPNCVGVFLHQ